MTTFRPRDLKMSRLLLACATVAVITVGCAGGPAVTGNPATGGPTTTAPASSGATGSPGATGQAGGWSWEDGETASVDGDGAIVDGGPGGQDAVELEPVGGDPSPGEATEDVALVDFDPCELVQPGEWVEFLGEMAPARVRLVADQACGWMNDADTLRLAIAVRPYVDEAGRYVDGALMAGLGGEAMDVSGVASTWIEGWPSAESSTLIVPLEGRDLVLEVSALEQDQMATLREMATHFAGIAMGRLP